LFSSWRVVSSSMSPCRWCVGVCERESSFCILGNLKRFSHALWFIFSVFGIGFNQFVPNPASARETDMSQSTPFNLRAAYIFGAPCQLTFTLLRSSEVVIFKYLPCGVQRITVKKTRSQQYISYNF
jgi:hypothetical protein